MNSQKLEQVGPHPSLLEQISGLLLWYGFGIIQVANIAVEDARTLTITPWEKAWYRH